MKLLPIYFLLFSLSCFAQEDGKRGTIKVEKAACTLVKNNDSIYSLVDMMPQFAGGIDSLNKWMNKKLVYPQAAMEEGRQGTVFLSFVVQADGRLSDIELLKGVNIDFEKEAMRLIRSMPKWEPGKCNGTIVPVKVNFPIKFSLQ